MPIFPKPYPDEIIGSVIARASFQAGRPLTLFLASLFGRQRNTASFLMSGDTKRIAHLIGLTPLDLIQRHTIFPYAVAFASKKDQLRYLNKAISRNFEEECLGSLTKNISHGVPARRICLDCIKDDFERYGESFWRRSHLLPGVLTCSIHRRALRFTTIPLRGHTQIRSSVLPNLNMASFENTFDIDDSIFNVLTSRSVQALNSEIEPRTNWPSVYRIEAMKKGYQMPRNAIPGRKLSIDMMHFFGEKLLQDAGCNFSVDVQSPWPALLVRDVVGLPFSTPRHIFFQTFCLLAPECDGFLNYQMPGKQPINFALADKKAAKKIEQILQLQAKDGTRITVKELLQRAEIWRSFLHNRTRYPQTNFLIQQFRSSDLSERQLGLRLKWRKSHQKNP